jgi:hypothetical protein
MIKILDFMDLSYKNLYSKSEYSQNIRQYLYKEKTNVLSYYIITLILINNFPQFLSWCQKHNISLLQFKKTTNAQNELCKFIEKKYKSKNLLDDVTCIEELLDNIKNLYKKKKYKNLLYILSNLRMTLCEIA